MWFVCFFVLVSTVGFLAHLYLRRVHVFWKNLRVPHTKPPLLLGDFGKGGWSKNVGVLLKELYDGFPDNKFFGIWMFTNPFLVVRDPELIKTIFVKDFAYFHDRGVYYNEKDDPLSAHLFAIGGVKWKNLRAKLSPTFTSGKMKMMFPLLVECSAELEEVLIKAAEKKETIEVKEIVARFMTDVISLCAFGIQTNSMKNPNAKFREMGKKALEPNLRNFITSTFQFLMPKMAEFLKIRVLSKEVGDYFLTALRDVMETREKNQITRNDFLQLLMQLKNKGAINPEEDLANYEAGEKLTFEEAAAEAFVFFIAGFETSSSTVQFALYELAKNPRIQEKLRSEIQASLAQSGDQMTYESILKIPYLEKVIEETLRKYPVVPLLQRQCKKDYRIPGSDVVIPEGTIVHVPIYAIQTDEKYFPEPERFDPERFSEEEKQKRAHYTYLPFGEGPRNCIGKRFGQMQVRVALIVLLRKFSFELSEKMQDSVTFDPKSFVLFPKGGIYLKISPLN